MPGLRTARLDLCLRTQRRGKQDGIKGTPRIECFSVKLQLMGGGQQRHAPSDNVATVIKLGIWQMRQALLQFVWAEVERDLQVSFRDRFAARDVLDNWAT